MVSASLLSQAGRFAARIHPHSVNVSFRLDDKVSREGLIRMSQLNHDAIVSRLKMLNSVDPQKAMDEVDLLIREISIKDLAQILNGTYQKISEELRIDWRFTAMQWKLGNHGRDEFVEACPEARFKVWSFPFRGSAHDDGA